MIVPLTTINLPATLLLQPDVRFLFKTDVPAETVGEGSEAERPALTSSCISETENRQRKKRVLLQLVRPDVMLVQAEVKGGGGLADASRQRERLICLNANYVYLADQAF